MTTKTTAPVCHNDHMAEVMERFDAWWRHQPQDRPVLELPVRSTRPRPPCAPGQSCREWWMDAEARVAEMLVELRHRPYVAETLPIYRPGIGPDLSATPLGVEIEFSDTTSWSLHTVEDIDDWIPYQSREPDFTNPYWSAVRKMTELGLREGAGEILTGLPDLHGTYDMLVSLRGPENVCMDLIDDPDLVQGTAMHFARIYRESLQRAWEPFEAAGQPATTWIHFANDRLAFVTSCDFLCLISVDMALQHVAPTLDLENEPAERNIFHLDGPGALRHLDWLLEREDLDAIQWVYGAGNGPARRWLDVYRKTLDAGKSVQVLAEDPDDALAVVRALGSQGVWISLKSEFDSREEAEAFVRVVESSLR